MRHNLAILANTTPAKLLLASAAIELVAAKGDSKLPTFTMNAYNGGAMMLPGWWSPVVVDLAGAKPIAARIPALRQHDMTRVVGHIDTLKVTSEGITASGVISGAGADAKEVAETSGNGFPWQASIGADPERIEYLDAGKTATVNGKTITGPANIVRACSIYEISFVPVGADTSTSANVAAQHSKGNSMEFEAWLTANGFDKSKLTASQTATLKAAFEAKAPEAEVAALKVAYSPAATPSVKKDDPVVDPDIKASRDRLADESKRVAGIAAACSGNHHDIEEKAIREGWTVDKTQLEVLRASRGTASTGRRATMTAAASLIVAAALEASLCLASGMPEKFVSDRLPTSQREQVMNQALSAEYRGASVQTLMDQVIQAAGGTFAGSRRDTGFIEAALKADRTIRAEGFSSVSLSGILANVANKALIQSYESVETVWPFICGIRSHADFKTHSRYRLDSTGAFKKVGPDGELKHAGLTDATYTNKLDTFGVIIALTRQMIINDDLGAFLQLPQLIGRMAALRIEEAVFTLLLSNPGTFFGTGNKNYISGGSSALSITSLTTANQKFSDQVDSNGKPILVSPKILLVGTALETVAQQLYGETQLNVTTTTDVAKFATNPHKGLYRPYKSPYINNTSIKDQDGAAITGQSATLWMLLADPNIRAAIAVAFLNGQRIPTIQSAETDFNTLGMQWRAFHDFGVGMEDTTAAVESAGA